MVVVTALIRAFLIDVGLLYSSVFLMGLVVVIVGMVGLVVVRSDKSLVVVIAK